MPHSRFEKLEEIYHAAIEMSADEQADFIKNECGDDTEMFAELSNLIVFSDAQVSFIDSPPDEFAAALFSESQTSILGKKIGRYEVERVIGEGGMGEVYLARDTKLARPVALKVLSSDMTRQEDRVMRFMHEARAASALNHPNILTIYEIDEYRDEVSGDSIHFISMEFVDGKTLQEIIYFENRPLKEILRLTRQVADGLAKAHEAGIIHRDLKPENIMVSKDGFVKILDFGLAKLTDPESELHALQQHQSRPGVILGTLGYMSPEQVRGDVNIDHRTDIFSLGCILYEALTKKRAFEGESTVDALHAIIHKDPKPVEEILSNIDPHLSAIVSKSISKDRLERYQDIRDLAADIEAFESGSGSLLTDSDAISEERTMVLEGPQTQLTVSKQFSRQRKQLTVMFADLAGAVDLLDGLDPEIAADIMHQLWEKIEKVVSGFEGRIEQRLSDRFITLFGADLSFESDPENAVRAGLKLKSEITRFFQNNVKEHFAEEFETEDEAVPLFRGGISTGTVVVGASGEGTEGILSGPTVNKAKRLLRAEGAGDLIITHDTYRHVRGVFEVSSAGRQKGRLYSVTGAKPRAFRVQTRGVEGIETKMVGRDGEMALLLDALHLAIEDSELQRVSVVGEAGLGKSRLLREFQDEADLLEEKYFVFRARGIETRIELPFGFLRDLFLFRFGIIESEPVEAARVKFVDGVTKLVANSGALFGEGPDLEMQAHFLGQVIGLDFSDSEHIKGILDDAEQIQDRALNYALSFFESVAAKQPIMMFLDDLQWADRESLEFIDRLAGSAAKSPIVLAEFMRPVLFERFPHWGEGTNNRSRIDLRSLSKREARRLVADILQKVELVSEDFRDLVVDSGAGNPLFIEELIKMLIEKRVVLINDKHWSIDEKKLFQTAIPATLTGVIQSRLDRLSAPEKAVLQRASVIGFEFWDAAVGHLEPGVNVQTVLESLRNKELLFQRQESVIDGSNEFVFKYALLRDVIYETVLISDRKAWHEKTAGWLIGVKSDRGNEFSIAIAEHYKKGGNWKEAAIWFGTAGSSALSAYAPEPAIRLIREALTLWFDKTDSADETSETLVWREDLVRAFWTKADFEEAIKESERMLDAAERLGDPYWRTRALIEISVCSFEKGETARAAEAAQKAVESGRGAGDTVESRLALANALFRHGRVLYSMGDHETAARAASESLGVALGTGEPGLKAVGLAYHLTGIVKLGLGDFVAAQEYFEKDIEVSREIGNRRIEANEMNSLGEIMRIRGKGKEALSHYRQAFAITKETNNRSSQIMITSNIGGALVLTGEYAAAETTLRELIDTVGDRGHFLIPESYGFLANALIGQGKLSEARIAASTSLRLSAESDNNETKAGAWHILGVIGSLDSGAFEMEGESVEAEQCFLKSLEMFSGYDLEDAEAQALYDASGFYSANGIEQKAAEMAGRAFSTADRLKIDIAAKSKYIEAGRELLNR